MLYFRTNILVLVLASLSLASWGGTTSAQEITDVPVATDAPISAADAGGADTGEMPILSGVETPTEAPVAGVETPTDAPVVGGDATSAIPSGNTPTGGEATTTTPPVAGIVGADYCTYSPDPVCYSNNGKPDCCLDDAVECPAEAAPCDDVVGSDTEAPTGGAATTTPPVAAVDADASAPPTPQSTDTSTIPAPGPTPVPSATGDDVFEPPAAVVGADYCTFAPEPTCYPNSNGKPKCCLDDAIECVADKPPCDVNDMDMEKDDSKAAATRTWTGTTMVLLLLSIIVDQL